MSGGKMSVTDKARMQRAYELDAEVGAGARDATSGILRMGCALKSIRDEDLFSELGYETIEEYAEDRWSIGRSSAFSYIAIIEKLPAAIVQRVGLMAKPISLRKLTALPLDTFEGVEDEEIERLVGLTDEELEAELAKNYDREKLGGRGPADLRRELITKAQYRSQRQKLQTVTEKAKRIEAERDEVQSALAEMRQLVEAAKSDKQTGALVKMVEELKTRLAELEGQRAAQEAKLAKGNEVGARALQLIGEIDALCNRFFDEVRVDTAAQWVEITDALAASRQALEDLQGRMADVILARINAGEIDEFSLAEPRNELEQAATTVKVMVGRKGK